MKKFLLIVFISLLGFTSYAALPTFIDGCLKHKVLYGTLNTHVAVVTFDFSPAPGLGGTPMSFYINGSFYANSAPSPVSLGSNIWVYEFNIGAVGTSDPHCINDVVIIPEDESWHATLQDYSICHCDYSIKDGCIRRGTYGNQVATILYGPDVQGMLQPLWYWDPAIPGFQGPYWPSPMTPNGTDWIYTYDLGIITGLISPMRLYTSYDITHPPTNINDPHIIGQGCGADMLYACWEGGDGVTTFTVAYDQGILGNDEYLFWYDGTNMVLCTLINKVMVNGIWKYTYSLVTPDPGPDFCYELYHSS